MSEETFEQAARWHAAQDREDMDWDAFTAWLEAEPRHRHAFDDVALLEERIGRYRPVVRTDHQRTSAWRPAADQRARSPRRMAGWGVTAAVVTMAAVVAVATLRQPERTVPPHEYRAGAVTQIVQLAGGARVSLAPGSVLVADAADRGHLSLSGRALFRVRHDPNRQLFVQAEGYQIRDMGTRFEVATGAGQVRVAVAEGRVAVRVPSGGSEVEVGAGRSLTGFADGSLATGSSRAKDVGGWQSGSLVYDRVPLGIVAADITRASGRRVEIDPAVRRRTFSGVLVAARGDDLVNTLASLTGLQARRDGDTIRLGDRAPR